MEHTNTCACTCNAPAAPAATLIENARVYADTNRFEEAILIVGDTIRAVGPAEALRRAAPEGTRTIDARGRLVIPGFNDSHCHLMSAGRTLDEIDLQRVRSLEEMLATIRAYLEAHPTAPGTVLHGRGWNHDFFTDVARMPLAADLDSVAPDVGLVLERTCGHVAVANTVAMRAAGITRDTLPNAGGDIGHDEAGEPNGIFAENALSQIYAAIPPVDRAARRRHLRAALRHAAASGVTSVHTMDVQGDNWQATLEDYDTVLAELPTLRVNHQMCFMTPELLENFLASGLRTGDAAGATGNRLNRVGPLKLFVDGSLGARTAFLRAPYRDDPTTSGIATLTPAELSTLVDRAVAAGLQTTIHAIGDGAIERVIDAYEAHTTENAGSGSNPARLGIVHVQITDRALLERMARRSILAHVQPIFLQYDTTIVEDRVGPELAATSYAFRTMEALGIPVSYGTDSPVEDLNPWQNLASAVTRTRFEGNAAPWHPEECVTVADAIDAYTTGSAFASFEEQTKGRLLPGYLADLVVCDTDLFALPAEDLTHRIANTRAVLTMTGGRIVWNTEGDADVNFD